MKEERINMIQNRKEGEPVKRYVIRDGLGIAYAHYDTMERALRCAEYVSIYYGDAYIVEMRDKNGDLLTKGRKIARYKDGREIPLFK